MVESGVRVVKDIRAPFLEISGVDWRDFNVHGLVRYGCLRSSLVSIGGR